MSKLPAYKTVSKQIQELKEGDKFLMDNDLEVFIVVSIKNNLLYYRHFEVPNERCKIVSHFYNKDFVECFIY